MGGFQKVTTMTGGGPLVVLYHTNLKQVRTNITEEGGSISKDIFSFPGGKRLHFTDTEGNELAVWSDT